MLNGYLEVAVERILARGGTINEILGDGLLVFFGAPIADDAAAEHAVAAALELQLAMAELNERHRASVCPSSRSVSRSTPVRRSSARSVPIADSSTRLWART